MTTIRVDDFADVIEQTLALSNIQSRVTGGVVTPLRVRFNLTGVRFQHVTALRVDIAKALHVDDVTIERNGGSIRLDMPRADNPTLDLLKLCRRLPEIPESTAVLGIASDGSPLLVRLQAKDVGHVLISGAAGMGKTSLLTSMLVSLSLCHSPWMLQLALIGESLPELAALPHTHLGATLDDMNYIVEQRTQNGHSEPLIMVAIDDATLADRNSLIALTQDGARAGVHVIATTRNSLDLMAWFPQHYQHVSEVAGNFESCLGRFRAAYIDDTQLTKLAERIMNPAALRTA